MARADKNIDLIPAASPQGGETIDELERQIIVCTQHGLPLESYPFDVIAAQLGVSADEIMQRIENMQRRGVIRRIAAVPNHYALGFRSNGMSVWDVQDELIDDLGKKVGALEFVSHCYQRPRSGTDWPYNLFAMVHARSHDKAMELVAMIDHLLGDACRAHDVLFSSEILKKTGLRLSPQ